MSIDPSTCNDKKILCDQLRFERLENSENEKTFSHTLYTATKNEHFTNLFFYSTRCCFNMDQIVI